MKDEIKEILEYLKNDFYVYGETYIEEKCKIVTKKENQQLLDYITNLQEYETIIEMEFKREYAKRYLEEKRKEEPHLLYPDSDEIYKRYYELKEENIKLKELCNKYEEEHNNAFKLWTMKMEEMPDYEERMNYKSRNEKAIEYINEMCLCSDGYANYGDDLRPEHIVNILQGSDKE